jgi:hypothetical protein
MKKFLKVVEDFFANKAYFTLFILMVMLAGLASFGVPFIKSGGAPLANASGGTRSSAAAGRLCGQFEVVFSSSAKFSDVEAFLKTTGLSIVFGPNENGAYELRYSRGSTGIYVQALEQSSLISRFDLAAQCL